MLMMRSYEAIKKWMSYKGFDTQQAFEQLLVSVN